MLNVVNHKNHDRSDNHFTNLEWCDTKYNINYSKHLMRNNKRYTSDEIAEKIKKDLLNGLSVKESAINNNVSYTVAYYIKTKRSFTHLK